MSHVGDLLRTRREQSGMSRKQMALATGYKNLNKQMSFLAALEDGRDSFPKESTLERFARVLGIDDGDVIQANEL